MYSRVSINRELQGRLPVVLVHGLSVSGRYLVPTGEQLAEKQNVYIPDLPGFGRSDRPPQVLDVAGLAAALAAWMDVLGLERAVLLGNSLGCQTIAEFALRYPQRLAAAVLTGLALGPEQRSYLKLLVWGAADLVFEPPALLPILLRDYLIAGMRRTLRSLTYSMQDVMEQKLPHMHLPVLVVRGSRDLIAPQRWAEQAVRLLPDARLAVIPGAAHGVNFSYPVQLAGLTQEFLDERYSEPGAQSLSMKTQ